MNEAMSGAVFSVRKDSKDLPNPALKLAAEGNPSGTPAETDAGDMTPEMTDLDGTTNLRAALPMPGRDG